MAHPSPLDRLDYQKKLLDMRKCGVRSNFWLLSGSVMNFTNLDSHFFRKFVETMLQTVNVRLLLYEFISLPVTYVA
jgi:hypothetical protein